ncbi:MAG: acyltransferase family protein [Eubacteriales bacterium]|nr:acyltransferase family protein [Eubacteriales bacterium]
MRERIHAFDFLRVLCLLGVIGYHYWPNYLPSGLLAVQGFFVLAAYLTMVKRQNSDSRAILPELGGRLRRLFPPLLILLLPLAVLMLLDFPDFIANFAGQLRSSLLGFNNYFQIFQGDSYFEGASYLKPLTHLWALSLEIQYYLLFYLFCWPFYRRERRLPALLIVLVLTCASLGFNSYLCIGGLDESRIYYDFLTRFYAFGFGIIAALIRREYLGPLLTSEDEAERDISFHLVQISSCLLLILICGAYFLPLELSDILLWALPAYALVFALALCLCDDKAAYLAVIGRFSLVKYLSEQSYWLYLIHYPVIRLSERYLAFVDLPAWAYPLIALSITIILAELARLCLKFLRWLFSPLGKSKLMPWAGRILAGLIAVGLIITPWGQIGESLATDELTDLQTKIAEEEARQLAERESIRQALTATRSTILEPTRPTEPETPVLKDPEGRPIDSILSWQKPSAEEVQIAPALLEQLQRIGGMAEQLVISKEDFALYRHIPVTIIGDSVSVIAGYHLEPYLPGACLDALSNRQMDSLLEVYEGLKQDGLLREVLVIALSTNGDPLPEELKKVHDDWQKPLVIVTIALPYPGQEEYRNSLLRKFAKEHENVWLVDWGKISRGRADFFMEDLIHPADPLGCQAYCQAIAAKVIEIAKLHDEAKKLQWQLAEASEEARDESE